MDKGSIIWVEFLFFFTVMVMEYYIKLGLNAKNLVTLRMSKSCCTSPLRLRMQLKLGDFLLDEVTIDSISEIFPNLKIHTN